MVSAPWRSSGKTMVSLGLARAARRRSLCVQTFKKGPDYIDPLWLAAASGTGCYNLDPYTQQSDELRSTFHHHLGPQTLAIVEGTMGLHDGLQSDGSDSNAAIARDLDLPVILVVDCRGMHRTVAALINGIQHFDRNVRFAGVILNRVRSQRHEEKIGAALERYCDINLVGVVPECRTINVDEQQLGLTPVPEFERSNSCIDRMADLVTDHCDLDTLFCGAEPVIEQHEFTEKSEISGRRIPVVETPITVMRIGIAKDAAFHFYYQDDLDTLKNKGVQLVEVSPVQGELPADLDGLIIGGGFPERHASALEGNARFRQSLQTRIANGLVVHAECAGLMYLCRTLKLDDGIFDMVGVIAGEVTLCKKPVGRGYVQLGFGDSDEVMCAHEFHHSTIRFEEPQQYRYRVIRGHGIDGQHDGVVCGNVHAGYAHFRHTRATPWIDWFLQRVKASQVCTATGTGD